MLTDHNSLDSEIRALHLSGEMVLPARRSVGLYALECYAYSRYSTLFRILGIFKADNMYLIPPHSSVLCFVF